MVYFITLLVFSAVILLVWAAAYQLLLRRSLLIERLKGLVPEKREKPEQKESGTWAYKLSKIGEKVKLPEKDHSKYAALLVAAGYRKESVALLLGSKILLACVLPVGYLAYAIPRGIGLTGEAILATAGGLAAGYLLPTYWLYMKKNKRQVEIFHTLPDILDLVTVCVEAGLSMDAALMRATGTPQFDNNALAREIRLATMETRAGKPRIEALRHMAERTQVEDVKSFASTLTQTERFGTSLSQALRTHADSLRTKRRQIAEEAAAKTTIKMIFPLILFIFPALLVVILGPAIIQVQKIFR
ncbi:type II secretion system F family protein [Geomonas sp. Red32]|uniref:type II secretion system F family protein n=1 Tax=Geomonas sp. Red32 TaxID=2912856 RepID=UPI00202CB4DB|nr:type II secretion system F family protein [Geomonas sp. Red32]MCM0082885.1 type II secretion system F family protein [Geomonas sp. Red32]